MKAGHIPENSLLYSLPTRPRDGLQFAGVPGMRHKQLLHLSSSEHGGSVRRGRRKIARPIAIKRPMHLVFRASRARGSWSFLHPRNKGMIHLILLECARRYHIRLYGFENVGNHMHLLVQVRSRVALQNFLRVFLERVMFQVTGARKGRTRGRFFDAIAYSRIVEWGREFKIVKTYLWKNAMEALGFSRKSLIWWSP